MQSSISLSVSFPQPTFNITNSSRCCHRFNRQRSPVLCLSKWNSATLQAPALTACTFPYILSDALRKHIQKCITTTHVSKHCRLYWNLPWIHQNFGCSKSFIRWRQRLSAVIHLCHQRPSLTTHLSWLNSFFNCVLPSSIYNRSYHLLRLPQLLPQQLPRLQLLICVKSLTLSCGYTITVSFLWTVTERWLFLIVHRWGLA